MYLEPIYAEVVEYGDGYAIEFKTRFGKHHGYFTNHGKVKVWQRIEGAEKTLHNPKYAWYVK